MAGRKSTQVKVLTYRDISLLTQLSNTGVCTFEQAYAHNSLNRDRILKLEKSGYIKHDVIAVKDAGSQDVIRLNDKGKSYCRTQLNIDNFYRSDKRQIKHDLKLTEAYYTVIKNHPEAVWKNETVLINDYKERTGQRLDACVDAVVSYEGGSIAIEVIGDKYSQSTIAQKEDIGMQFADRVCKI